MQLTSISPNILFNGPCARPSFPKFVAKFVLLQEAAEDDLRTCTPCGTGLFNDLVMQNLSDAGSRHMLEFETANTLDGTSGFCFVLLSFPLSVLTIICFTPILSSSIQYHGNIAEMQQSPIVSSELQFGSALPVPASRVRPHSQL